jgi:hypothetical protein
MFKYSHTILGQVPYNRARYCRYGLLHRDNGPALIWYNGHTFWYQNGIHHEFENNVDV